MNHLGNANPSSLELVFITAASVFGSLIVWSLVALLTNRVARASEK